MGGYAVKSSPIIAYIAEEIYKEIEKRIHEEDKFKDIDMCVLGSIGKKKDNDTNGDIDIAIKIDSKEKLNEIVDTCFSNCEINYNTMKTITSIGYPYTFGNFKGIAQVDFMMVKDMEWAKIYYHSPNYKKNESKYKGAVRTAILSDVISCIGVPDLVSELFKDGSPKRIWKHTLNSEGIFIQLVDYCGKNGNRLKNGKKLKEYEKLVTNTSKGIIDFLFTDKGSIDDLNSAESIWKAIHDEDKFKYSLGIVKSIEEKVWNDKNLIGIIYSEDFPCKYYGISN